MRTLIALGLLLLGGGAAATPSIDGVFDAAEWAGAQHFDQFVAVQPLTGAPAPADRRAEAWLTSTADGIAVAIRAWHPAAVAQTRQRIQRDGTTPVDRFNLMIDFNADGRSGYDFMITTAGDVSDETISNENAFSYDWDGDWQHAAGEFDGGHVVEFLIPWSIAPMADSSAARRSIGVYFDRVIAATGERYGYPEASFTRPRFLSDFARIEIDQFPSRQLAITPYGVAMADLRQSTQDFKTGADLFWKPNGDHQFALTLNPDFGQVESDELVVNFTDIETFYTDKRPFFTENQNYFDLQHNLGTLFYTRRVGGAADDGSGAAEIAVAGKATGSVGGFGYGVFAASEDGDAGRDFNLLRATHGSDGLLLGLSHSEVERPFFDRQAAVTAVDARWQPNALWLVRPLLLHSEVEQAGSRRSGHGAGVVADWDMPGPWRQQYFALYSDRELQLNDLGYAERNNYRLFEWESGYRQDDLDAASRYASHAWEFELVQQETLDSLLLRRTYTAQRYSERRNGGNLFFFARWRDAAFDDRLSRGNGAVPLQSAAHFFIEGNRSRQGDGRFSSYWNLEVFPNVHSGHSVYGGVQPRWHVNHSFDVDLGLYAWRQSDWLLWQQGREFGSFRTQRAELFSNLNWFIDERQELRVKLQAIAIDAEAKQARRLDASGRLVDSAEPLRDFSLRNLGFQMRYRYKLGALSDLFVVYSRGGYALDEFAGDDACRGLNDSLADAFALRDNDQLLVKLAYRFDLL